MVKMLNLQSTNETFLVLLIKIKLVPEEQLGELFPLLSQKKNQKVKKEPKISNFLEIIKLKSRRNYH